MEKFSAKFSALMSKKVGGVPVALIAVLVAGVFLYFAIRMKASPDAPTDAPTDEAATTDGGDLGQPGQPVFAANPSLGNQPVTADTNELWARRSIEWLAAKEQGIDPGLASRAIQKYIGGEGLTTEERRIRDKAIAHFGLPPEIPPYADDVADIPGTDSDTPNNVPPDNGNGPKNGPGSKQGEPPVTHTVTGRSDNGPRELAILYYGSGNLADTERIRAANSSLPGSPYPVGTKVKIPEKRDPKYYTATRALRGLNEIAANNGVGKEYIKQLNPGMNFPVAVGTRVRVR